MSTRDNFIVSLQIHEVTGMRDGDIVLRQLYRFVETGERNGTVLGNVERTDAPLLRTDKLLASGLPVPDNLSLAHSELRRAAA